MNQLFWEVVGWLGYLQRTSIIFQLALIIIFVVYWRLVRRHITIKRLPKTLHLLIAPDLELAELDEATSKREGSETGVHPLPLEAVQHHIHAAACGVLQNLTAKQRGT